MLRFGLRDFFSRLLFLTALLFWGLSLFFPAVGNEHPEPTSGIECLIYSTVLAFHLSDPVMIDRVDINLSRIAFPLHLLFLSAVLAMFSVPFFAGRVRYAISFFLFIGAAYFYWAAQGHFQVTYAGYRLWLSSFFFMSLALLVSRRRVLSLDKPEETSTE